MIKDVYDDIKSTIAKGNDLDERMNQDFNSNTEIGGKELPEIDISKPSNATKIFPDEVPRRDGPGGE